MVSGGDDRSRIRRALIDLCYERGLAATTLPDLLARADVEEAAFQRYFSDLEDCFFRVYRGELERFRREKEAARAGWISWRDQLRATAYALYRFLAADDRLRWLTTVEVRRAGERSQLLIGEEIEALFELIDEGRLERSPSGVTRMTAESIGGGIFSQIWIAAAGKGQMPPEAEVVPPLMSTAVLPYLGPEAAEEELTIPPSDHRESPIYAALIDLGWEHGVSAITEDELALRAGIDRAEFDRHFDSVEHCFEQFYEAEQTVIFRRLEAARAGHDTWRDRLRATAYELRAFLGENERAAKLTCFDVRVAGERVQLNWAQALGRFVDWVDEGRTEAPPDLNLSRDTALAVAGGIFQQLWTRIGVGGEIPEPGEVVPEMMYMAVLPYLGEEAAREELEIAPPRSHETT